MSDLEQSNSDIQRLKAALHSMATGNKTDKKALFRLQNKLGMHYFELLEKLDNVDFTVQTIEKILKDQEITDANNYFVYSRMKQITIVRTGLVVAATLTFLLAGYFKEKDIANLALGILTGSAVPEMLSKNEAKRK